MDENILADNAVETLDTTESLANSTTETPIVENVNQPNQLETKVDNVTDITTTKAFSERLKESTQKAIDAEYSRLYGADYGIHTKADYDTAILKQKQAEEAEKLGIDPEAIKPFFETWKQNDPDFKELNSIRQANNISKALNDLNAELKDNGVDLQLTDLSDAEVAKIPNVDKVTEYVAKGHTLADAVFLANKKDFIARQTQQTQQETIKKIAANGASSPGSLTGSATTGEPELSDETIDKMTPQQRMANWTAIKKFYGMK